ncbi:hypothetical protein FOA52_012706 [Chlamydomonas sp. UWO 241]|nr:hypothetical protein FOA52_012706 [Chlamydomonas sp. UWO 241]
MSAAYQKSYSIPSGYPALLKAFTREILRSQPENIYQFGAEYFAALRGSDGAPGEVAQAEAPGDARHGDLASDIKDAAAHMNVTSASTSELESVIMRLFIEADADGSGYLDKKEFANVLNSTELSLNERQVREVMCEADENDDGVIEYREFVPFMVDMLQSMQASEGAQMKSARNEDLLRIAVEDMLLNGMTKPELEALMMRIFKKADSDGSGMLDKAEFRVALMAAKLGLTRKDINLIMFSVDANNDGEVSYEEFVPVCFQVLVERFKDKIIMQDVLTNQEGLQGMLLAAFQDADPEGTGSLSIATIKAVLKELSHKVLGLSTLQLVTLISRAPTTPDGLVSYVPFVPIAASVVYAMYDVDSVKLRIQAVKEMASADGIAAMSTMDVDKLRETLRGLFEQADAGGSGSLYEDDVLRVLQALGAHDFGMELSEMQMRAMFTAIDTDANGLVDWQELVTFICDAIEHLEREAYINNLALK